MEGQDNLMKLGLDSNIQVLGLLHGIHQGQNTSIGSGKLDGDFGHSMPEDK